MTLHKRAICLEQLGRKAEALAALDRAEPLCAAENCPVEESLAREMLALARCRLEREKSLVQSSSFLMFLTSPSSIARPGR